MIFSNEEQVAMLKRKHLVIVDRFITLTMGFSMGFLVGMNYPQARVIWFAVVIGVCAFAKVELHHWAQKLQKSEKAQKTPES